MFQDNNNYLTPTLFLVSCDALLSPTPAHSSLSIQVGMGIIFLEKPEPMFPSGNGWTIETNHILIFWLKHCLMWHQILEKILEETAVSITVDY